ncbi:MAG TPA: TolC family protein [Bryobacteraceae bacterium]|nr:TolC family protein [Bryobacteraceae bacterium]
MPIEREVKFRYGARWLVVLLAAIGALPAQPTVPPTNVTITQAVEDALKNYPSIRVTQEQMNAAATGIRLAQTAYLPRVDGLAQVNRATRNTFYGMLLPQATIPALDGVPANNLGSVWDSGAGILVTWQPFDFGLRAANVAIARAGRERAQATVNRTRYDVSVATADAFLTLVAAQQTAEAARGAVDSWQVFLKSIHALVAAQLRPGADESRVQAELAVAQTQLVQAEQAIEVARSTLAQFVGLAPSGLNLSPGKLVDQLPPEQPETPLQPAANPLVMEQNAAIVEARAQLQATERSYFPQFSLQGSASARGTGLELNGDRLGGWNGLAPTTQNYGIGFTVTFPFMDQFAQRAQEAQEAATIRANQAQYQLVSRQLTAQFDSAQATLTGTRRVAATTPVEVSSARAALQQATARYRSGLAPIDDVAQAQRLLVQAQIDDSLARLNVWRARLQVATVRGDIQLFLVEASQ